METASKVTATWASLIAIFATISSISANRTTPLVVGRSGREKMGTFFEAQPDVETIMYNKIQGHAESRALLHASSDIQTGEEVISCLTPFLKGNLLTIDFPRIKGHQDLKTLNDLFSENDVGLSKIVTNYKSVFSNPDGIGFALVRGAKNKLSEKVWNKWVYPVAMIYCERKPVTPAAAHLLVPTTKKIDTDLNPTLHITPTSPTGMLPNNSFENAKKKDMFAKFQLDVLNAHNTRRASHSAPKMELNKKICDDIQKQVDRMAVQMNQTGRIETEQCWYRPTLHISAEKLTADELVQHFYKYINRAMKEKNNKDFENLIKFYMVFTSVYMLGYYPFLDTSFFDTNISLVPDTKAPLISLPVPNPLIPSTAFEEDEGTTFTPLQNQLLKALNERRKKHGAQPMRLSQKLCEYAQGWAPSAAKLYHKKLYPHNPKKIYGENIYGSTGCTVTGENVLMGWYEGEIYDYYPIKIHGSVTGHFTEAVWKGYDVCDELWQRYVGFGVATFGNWTVVVMNSFPKGNMEGLYETNVCDTNPPTQARV